MRLRDRHWRSLLDAIANLYSDVSLETLPERALGSIGQLLPGEIIAFDSFTDDGVHTGDIWHDPPGTISPELYAVFGELASEHPFSPYVFSRSHRHAMMTSDYVSLSDFKNGAIFNEFYRHFPVHHQLLVPITTGPGTLVTCTTNRRGKNFTEEERLMLNLIAPHMGNAIHNSRKMRELTSTVEDLSNALETRSCGIVSLDKELKIVYISHFCTKLIEKYIGKGTSDGESLPDFLISWIRQNDPLSHNGIPRVPSALKLELPNSTLSVTIMFDEKNDERFLILEESREAAPSDFHILGLTKRQAEILFWLSRGKTDRDIGEILCISHRTVHKHLEAIYTHLGVETRTAAMQIALSTIRN